MPEPATTEELIKLLQAAKSGDKQAFSAVYSAFYLPIFRYCQKRLRHLPDSEDIAQQVFLRLYNSRSEFSNQNLSPLNYLYTIARNCLVDFWAKQNRTPVNIPEDFDTPDPTEPGEAVLSQVAAEELLQVVSVEERTILTLRVIEGFSSRAVALKVNKSEMAVRQIQCRALKKIRDYYTSSSAYPRAG